MTDHYGMARALLDCVPHPPVARQIERVAKLLAVAEAARGMPCCTCPGDPKFPCNGNCDGSKLKAALEKLEQEAL